jgi:DNA-binding XRE family transcriptional regulator
MIERPLRGRHPFVDNPMTENPTPVQIQQARAAADHTQQQAAQVIGITGKAAWRTWSRWETGPDVASGRSMQPGLFELYLIKTDQHPEFTLTPRTRPLHSD